jgi:hypothetical protein
VARDVRGREIRDGKVTFLLRPRSIANFAAWRTYLISRLALPRTIKRLTGQQIAEILQNRGEECCQQIIRYRSDEARALPGLRVLANIKDAQRSVLPVAENWWITGHGSRINRCWFGGLCFAQALSIGLFSLRHKS